jgi:hypothetical protein
MATVVGEYAAFLCRLLEAVQANEDPILVLFRTLAWVLERLGSRVLPDGFLLKAIVFPVCEHEYMNIPPPPPPPQLLRLATALQRTRSMACCW